MMNPRVLLSLVVLYFVYMIVGAAVFMACERPYEIKRCEEAKVTKKYWMKITEENKEFDEKLLNEFILNVTRFTGFGISLQGEVKCPVNWDFQSSVFFAGTIITTIGYGNLAPVQWYSQIFCIIYALIGIPLFAIMFSGLGQYISEVVKKILESFHLSQSPNERRIQYSIYSFIIIVGGSIVLFQLIPAIIFMHVEGWSYRESFYFCFISLATIGFGDYVVGANPQKSYIALYRIMVLFWLLFGLAYTFTAINLIVDIFRKSFARSSLIKSCLKAWSEAEEDVYSEVESLLGAGSSNGGEDFDMGIGGNVDNNAGGNAGETETDLRPGTAASSDHDHGETGLVEPPDDVTGEYDGDTGLIDATDGQPNMGETIDSGRPTPPTSGVTANTSTTTNDNIGPGNRSRVNESTGHATDVGSG